MYSPLSVRQRTKKREREGERETETETETDRQTDRDRDRERQRETQRQTDRQTDRQRDRDRERQRQRDRENDGCSSSELTPAYINKELESRERQSGVYSPGPLSPCIAVRPTILVICLIHIFI